MGAPPFDAATLTTLEALCRRAIGSAHLDGRLDVHELMHMCVERLRLLEARGRSEDQPPWSPDFLRSVARRNAQEWLRGERRCRTLKFPEQVAARPCSEPRRSVEHVVDVLATAPRPATALEARVLDLRLGGRTWGEIADALGLRSRSRPGKLWKSVLERYQTAWEHFGDLKPAPQPPSSAWARHSGRLQAALCDVRAGEHRRTICQRHQMTRGALRTLICLHGGEAAIRTSDACGDTCAITYGAAQSLPVLEPAVAPYGPPSRHGRSARSSGDSAMARTIVPLVPKGAGTVTGASFRGPWIELPATLADWNLVVGVHSVRAGGSARLRLQTSGPAGIAMDVGDEVAIHDHLHLVQALPGGIGPRVRLVLDLGGSLDARIAAYLEAPAP